jgi:hypothetical protein
MVRADKMCVLYFIGLLVLSDSDSAALFRVPINEAR